MLIRDVCLERYLLTFQRLLIDYLTIIIIAKLNAYGFDMKALNFIYDYLSNRKQRTKIDNAYSSWQNILHGVPQGSILRPLMFNRDLCDFFFHNES